MMLSLANYWLSLYYWDRASNVTVKKMQLRKFSELFDHAKKKSRFYKEFYKEHGVYDLKIESHEDIAKVPVVCKEMLRKYPIRDIMTCDLDERVHLHSTSGSTGEPFQVACNPFEDYSGHVRLTKALMEKGYRPFDRMAILSRYEEDHAFPIESDIKEISLLQRMGLFRRELISIFDPVEVIIQRLEKINPVVVWSTPSVMETIARKLKDTGRRLNIPLVLLMAETILPAFKDLLLERIGSCIIDLYGCMESPSIGFGSALSAAKTVFCNSTLVEVIREREVDGRAVGDIVITNLINRSMPFIRYDLADHAEILPDDSFPNRRIGGIFGRCDDVIHFGNGHSLAFHQTYQLFASFRECIRYKFVEIAPGEIVLQLTVAACADKEQVKRLALQKWGEKYPDYLLRIEWKDDIPIDRKTGKFKVIEKFPHNS